MHRPRLTATVAVVALATTLGPTASAGPATASPSVASPVGRPSPSVLTALSVTAPVAALHRSTSAMTRARSVRIQGLNKVPGGFESVDLIVTAKAAEATFGSTGLGTYSVVRLGSTLYLNGDAAFWAAPGRGGSPRLAGTWIRLAAGGPVAKDLSRRTTLTFWAAELAALPVTRSETGKVIRKRKAVAVTAPAARGTTVYLAATGRPYPLRALTPDENYVRDYLDWDKKVTFVRPHATLVVTV